MQRYVGMCEQPNRFRIEVLIREHRLFIKEFNQEMPLTNIGEHKFSFKFPQANQPLEIYMKPEANGGLPRYVHQFVWAFKRVDTRSAPASPVN